MLLRTCDRAATSSCPVLRSLAFAVLALSISLLTHVAVGGRPPDLPTWISALILTGFGYWALAAGRERSCPQLVVGLTVTEASLHTLFMSGGLGAVAPTGHAHLGGPSDLLPGPSMLAAHLVAGLVLGWFLRQGEGVLWAVARRMARAVVDLRSTLRCSAYRAQCTGRVTAQVRPRPGSDAGWHVWVPRHWHLTRDGALWRGPPQAGTCL